MSPIPVTREKMIKSTVVVSSTEVRVVHNPLTKGTHLKYVVPNLIYIRIFLA
jgi:hypothetical protein